MVSVDGSLFIQIINFLFLLFVLNLILFKPIRKVLLERKEKINGLEQGIESLENQAVSQDQAYKDGLKEARTIGLKKKEAFVGEASQEEKEIIDRINKTAQSNLAQIRTQVAEETEKARVALEAEVELFSKAIGEKILGRAC
ncbi:AtpF3 [Desulforapulum autotrophicum HRM2]|uniref:AtpF3 n=1 Tax=Desulforapulum autotrophicum (strain ATCC 43914 / DSM 3382 / VKM B-1955 / HRM2) TaxID=177437 RepID=C0Q983_DESAH|nr:ATPase [Desulforapulum autotrophicum]ACN16588.1 AtpF3 [Desulforapulum autotrophicum HRM2]